MTAEPLDDVEGAYALDLAGLEPRRVQATYERHLPDRAGEAGWLWAFRLLDLLVALGESAEAMGLWERLGEMRDGIDRRGDHALALAELLLVDDEPVRALMVLDDLAQGRRGEHWRRLYRVARVLHVHERDDDGSLVPLLSWEPNWWRYAPTLLPHYLDGRPLDSWHAMRVTAVNDADVTLLGASLIPGALGPLPAERSVVVLSWADWQEDGGPDQEETRRLFREGRVCLQVGVYGDVTLIRMDPRAWTEGMPTRVSPDPMRFVRAAAGRLDASSRPTT